MAQLGCVWGWLVVWAKGSKGARFTPTAQFKHLHLVENTWITPGSLATNSTSVRVCVCVFYCLFYIPCANRTRQLLSHSSYTLYSFCRVCLGQTCHSFMLFFCAFLNSMATTDVICSAHDPRQRTQSLLFSWYCCCCCCFVLFMWWRDRLNGTAVRKTQARLINGNK